MDLHKAYIAVRNGDGEIYNFKVTKVNKKTAKGCIVDYDRTSTTDNDVEVTVALSDYSIKGSNAYYSFKVYDKHSDIAVDLINKFNDRKYAIQVSNYIKKIATNSNIAELIQLGVKLDLEQTEVFS